MNKKFYVFNSFTDKAFCGNPAGVVPDADDLTTEQMHAIARQLNLVETVFICKPSSQEAYCKLRYFMPEHEIPIAGHPTIAAWACLIDTGKLAVNDDKLYIQETGAGNIQIQIKADKIFTTQKLPTIHVLENISWTEISDIFNIDDQFIDKNYPAAAVDAGLGHLIFCVKSQPALMTMKFVPEKLKRFCEKIGVRECQIFCFETIEQDYDAHTRNLCPRYGLEDPACGNGNAALGAYFSKFIRQNDEKLMLKFEQGRIVNMAATIEVIVKQKSGVIEEVLIGGSARKMIEGILDIS